MSSRLIWTEIWGESTCIWRSW